MGDLKTQNSSYPTSLDTQTQISNNVSDSIVASFWNGMLQAIVAVENELGLSLKGNAATLAARLARCLNADGSVRGGTTFPTSPTPLDGDLFYRTDIKTVFIYDAVSAQFKSPTAPPGAITSTELADLSVITQKLNDLAVTTAKIADLAVTTLKIADLSVTTLKIADLSIITTKLADLVVTTAKIADLAVTTLKIADLAVTDAKIAATGITTRSKLPAAIAYEDEANAFAQTTTFNQQVTTNGGVVANAAVTLAASAPLTTGGGILNALLKALDLPTNIGGQLLMERVLLGVLSANRTRIRMESDIWRTDVESGLNSGVQWDLRPTSTSPPRLILGEVPFARISGTGVSADAPSVGFAPSVSFQPLISVTITCIANSIVFISWRKVTNFTTGGVATFTIDASGVGGIIFNNSDTSVKILNEDGAGTIIARCTITGVYTFRMGVNTTTATGSTNSAMFAQPLL